MDPPIRQCSMEMTFSMMEALEVLFRQCSITAEIHDGGGGRASGLRLHMLSLPLRSSAVD